MLIPFLSTSLLNFKFLVLHVEIIPYTKDLPRYVRKVFIEINKKPKSTQIQLRIRTTKTFTDI